MYIHIPWVSEVTPILKKKQAPALGTATAQAKSAAPWYLLMASASLEMSYSLNSLRGVKKGII